MYIFKPTYWLLFSYELCQPTTTKKCELAERDRCRYEYKTTYEEKEVCKDEVRKVCDKV